MKELHILLPVQGMDSLSLDGSAKDGHELLMAWSVAYHPSILRKTGQLANPYYGLYVYDEPIDKVMLLPAASRDVLEEAWIERAKGRGCLFLEDFSSTEKLVDEILAALREEGEESVSEPACGSVEISTDEFLALGMVHLLSEVLSRKQHYTSYLDSFGFKKNILEAVRFQDEGNENQARFHFQSAWDQLIQSRQYYAPADGYSFDLAMWTEPQLAKISVDDVRAENGTNVLLDGQTAERLAAQFPALAEALRAGVDEGRITLVGGESLETEWPLLSPEGILRRLGAGLTRYGRALGIRPTVFGRRKFGLTPLLPGILKQWGFQGALHSTMDEGVFPVRAQSRILWKGLDGGKIEAISRIPSNAADARAICDLPTDTAKALNVDNAFGALFAHWGQAGSTTEWYRYLRLAAKWVPMFGAFMTLGKCLEETRYSSAEIAFQADEYRSPYLVQAVLNEESNPISRWSRYYQTRTALEALAGLEGMVAWMVPQTKYAPQAEKWLRKIDASEPLGTDFYAACDVEIRQARQRATQEIARTLSEGEKRPNAKLWLNPWSFPSRKKIPGFGFVVRSKPSSTPTAPEPKRSWFQRKPQAPPSPIDFDRESGTWRMTGEQLELRLDAYTGHLRAVYDHVRRGNRLSQQLAMRTAPSPMDTLEDDDAEFYSIQAADEIRPEKTDEKLALHVSGRLVSRQGELLSRFTQITTLRREDSVIEWDIYFEPLKMPGKNPWQSYYASRLVWSDATADLFRNVGWGAVETRANRLEAPYFIDIRPIKIATTTRMVSSLTQGLAENIRGEKLRDEAFLPERDAETEYADERLTLLTCGLPYHRRIGTRKLDTLLLVRGETCRHFRMGIALNQSHPIQSARTFFVPPFSCDLFRKEPTSAWLGRLGHRNVLLTHWQNTPDGAILRFAETEGRTVHTTFQAARDILHAEQTDFLGATLQTLPVEKGQVGLTLPPFGFLEVRIFFTPKPES